MTVCYLELLVQAHNKRQLQGGFDKKKKTNKKQTNLQSQKSNSDLGDFPERSRSRLPNVFAGKHCGFTYCQRITSVNKLCAAALKHFISLSFSSLLYLRLLFKAPCGLFKQDAGQTTFFGGKTDYIYTE